MKIKRIVGLVIIAISVLTFSIQISIAQLAMYIDQTTPEFWTDTSKYIPNIIYACTLISIGIGIYLLFNKDKIDKN